MLTDKERMELLNLRNRVAAQREEIKRLREQVKHPEGTSKGRYTTMKTEERVLDYIQRNGSITALQAVRDLGIMRLASRIKELRDLGHPIDGVMRYAVNKDGVNKKWKEYYLA